MFKVQLCVGLANGRHGFQHLRTAHFPMALNLHRLVEALCHAERFSCPGPWLSWRSHMDGASGSAPQLTFRTLSSQRPVQKLTRARVCIRVKYNYLFSYEIHFRTVQRVLILSKAPVLEEVPVMRGLHRGIYMHELVDKTENRHSSIYIYIYTHTRIRVLSRKAG